MASHPCQVRTAAVSPPLAALSAVASASSDATGEAASSSSTGRRRRAARTLRRGGNSGNPDNPGSAGSARSARSSGSGDSGHSPPNVDDNIVALALALTRTVPQDDPAAAQNDACAHIVAPAAELKSSLPRDGEAATAQSQTTQPQPAASPGMIFSDFYKSPRSPLAKLRHHHPPLPTQLPTATPDWADTEYADLLSKDKAKQKEAVRRYLADKVKVGWEFPWPSQAPAPEAPAPDEESQQAIAEHGDGANSPTKQVQDETLDDEGYQVDEGSEPEEPPSEDGQADDQDDDARSIYSVVSEDAVHYRPRTEWTSDLSDDDAPAPSALFRSDTPDSMPYAAKAAALEKQARRRRVLRDEMAWNDGLACFEARRNAWTGARTVRVRSKPVSPSPASPRSPRRFFFRRSMSGSPPSSMPGAAAHSADASGTVSDASSLARDTHDRDLKKQQTQSSAVSDSESPQTYPVETLVPIGQPLLPPTNPLRASISPAVYLNLYDKVILNNLQPACPVNLSDMLRSCVAGWKRDGEWPPRASAMDPVMAMRRKKKAVTTGNENSGNVTRRMSFGLLGREKDDESRAGKGIRRSLQRALGIGIVPGNPDAVEGEKPREV
ncbi:hypothetical protein TOPH_02628 [Tolypocladium ophioglossoides CBS 100239]|uniref:Gag1-like clamp domain-containing protein n=1 Tax=Tolypocladium ophioglossoides (strain CBS 100239) TaxID=1163406 RepID=A0A0L0NFA6_TOLOC|nr:hypothetical protein TOPH_02628 [Tolypocladium ophioglossoides CBS 100239]